MNLRFLALPAALAAVLALSGCANDNARYRADVYGPGSLNQAQAVKTVEILSVQTARIALPNETKNSAAQLAGTVAGAAAGMILGNNSVMVRAPVRMPASSAVSRAAFLVTAPPTSRLVKPTTSRVYRSPSGTETRCLLLFRSAIRVSISSGPL